MLKLVDRFAVRPSGFPPPWVLFTTLATLATLLFTTPSLANDLGRAATPAEIAAWDIDIRPDGQGLPEGGGTPADGEPIYNDRCATCHGVFGEGEGRWPVLVGGDGTLEDDRPVKTIGSYWPYASTVWDYIHRAMPFGDAQSLGDDEVYALTAYVLYMNDIIDDEDFELTRENFADIEMPNEGGFIADERPDTMTLAKGEPCMSDCTPEPVKITMRAAVLDVTPETEATTDEGETVTIAATAPAFDADLAAKGKKVFKKCGACHQVGEKAKNRTGPLLNGVMGRAAGEVEKFRYSKAMKKAAAEGLIWNAETLGWYLEAPRTFMKGTKMSFKGLPDEDDRAAVIEYLKQFE